MKTRTVKHHEEQAIKYLERAKAKIGAEDIAEANRLINLAQVEMSYMELAAMEARHGDPDDSAKAKRAESQ